MHPPRLRAAALLTTLLLAIAGCAGSGPSDTSQTVVLAENPWSGSRVDAAVAALLLEEQLDIPVRIEEVDEYDQWERIARGELHACLEVWPSGHADDIAEYIDHERRVVRGGDLGVVGKIGWYVPTYVLADHPAAATWEGLADPALAALFATPASGGRGQFLAGDPSWVQYDADIIANLGLDFDVVFAGSESALLEQLAGAYANRQPLLFYFWRPHAAHHLYDLTEVQLPPHTTACYDRAPSGGVDCDYPIDVLIKVFWSGLAASAPRAHEFLSRFHYDIATQTDLIAAVELDGMTPAAAARAWVDANPDIWQRWLPEK